ncbi:MAG: WD40 repeat domain-containing serine/threonine protein kinase [Fimbriiglobus sp.]
MQPELRSDPNEREVFLIARVISNPADRVAYLQQLEAENPIIAKRVRQLLQADDTNQSLFDTPRSEPVKASQDDEFREAPVTVTGYEVLEVLGRGGMSVVYRAEQLALKRTVALKMILAGAHASREQRARFRIEAEAVARLQHPNIVQIHEVGESGGYPYCALEFVEGGTLAQKLSGKPMPAHEAAKLMETLARAMQLAHSRNVVHRDLKPANIMLTLDGIPKITDFGLARQLDSDAAVTYTGVVMGTPAYMAPEQAMGQAHQAGPAADVYALGAILYECLTGKPPFQGKTLTAILDQVRSHEPAAPSSRMVKVPLDLETICLKCLRKEPENRYASALELAEELLRFQNGEPIRARPISRAERGIKWVKRNPAVAVSVAIVLLVLMGVTLASVVVADQFRDMAKTQTELAGKEKASRLTAEAASDASRRDLYHAESTLALRSLASMGSDERLKGYVDRWLPNEETASFFGWEWRLAQRLTRSAWKSQKFDRAATSLEFSPDGKNLVVGDEKLMLLDPESMAVLKQWPFQAGIRGMRWEPSGTRIAVSSIDRASLFDVSTGKILWQQPAFNSPRMAWDPQSRWVAFLDQPLRCRIADPATGSSQRTLSQIDEAFTFSPDGKHFVAVVTNASHSHSLVFWRTVDWKEEKTIPLGVDFVKAMSFSSDGKQIAVGSAIGAVLIFDAMTGTRTQSLEANGKTCESLEWEPSGRWLAGHDIDGQIRVWETSTWMEVPLCRGAMPNASSLRWRPSGTELLAGSEFYHFHSWKLDEQHSYWTHHFGTRLANTSYLSCAWHPDSQALAGSGAAPGTIVWGVDGQRKLRQNGVEWQWTSDGQYSASVLGEDVTVWDAKGKPIAKVNLPGQPKVLAWQPKTLTLAIRTANRVHLWQPTTGQAPELVYGEPLKQAIDLMEGNRMAWSPDGTKLALSERLKNTSETSRVHVMSVANRSILRTFAVSPTRIHALAWSPDSQQIGVGRDETLTRIYDAASGQQMIELSGHGGPVRSIAWHPTENRTVTASVDGTARVWDTTRNRPVVTLDLGAPVRCVAWSPDGNSLAAAAESGTIHVWNGYPRAK